jgi:uncharacterized membrane protein
MMQFRTFEIIRSILRWLALAFFVTAGVCHFLKAAFYVQIVPPGFPSPHLLVMVSGACEITGGLGLLIPKVRKPAGWGLLVLLVAVFPANIYMALHSELFGFTPWLLWARLPLQLVIGAWVWFVALREKSL